MDHWALDCVSPTVILSIGLGGAAEERGLEHALTSFVLGEPRASSMVCLGFTTEPHAQPLLGPRFLPLSVSRLRGHQWQEAYYSPTHAFQ